MGCCNEPVTTLTGLPPDPSQHVNYERGMVLGVDDFRQEFAYQSGRDQWLARDAIGYGTLSGLRVYFEDDGTDGPRLHVTAGSALVPSGKLACVPADQCAVINRWLARPDNAALVNRLLSPASPPAPPVLSPPVSSPTLTTGDVSLYLTLCYTDCLTRPVPIPGEPCRSEDELMKPSRVADDFCLELRERPPVQMEEDALRDFMRWLRGNVPIVDTSPPPAADETAWLAALTDAAQPWLDAQAASSPLSPPASFVSLGDYLFDLSPPALSLAREQLPGFLRVALRFWVTQLRPLWMAMRCHKPQHADGDCLLLARVNFQVTWIGGSPTGAWQITGSPTVVQIDESTRPVLVPARLLLEWSLDAGADDAGTGGAAPYVPGGPVVAVEDGGTGLGAPPQDGEVLIGSGGGYALAGITGTADHINVASSPGSITLSAPQGIAPGSAPRFAGLTTTGAVHVRLVQSTNPVTTPPLVITLDQNHHVVICNGEHRVQLPKCDPGNVGRIYIVKSTIADSTVLASTGDTIDGTTLTPGLVKRKNAKTFVSDGNSTWHVIATAP